MDISQAIQPVRTAPLQPGQTAGTSVRPQTGRKDGAGAGKLPAGPDTPAPQPAAPAGQEADAARPDAITAKQLAEIAMEEALTLLPRIANALKQAFSVVAEAATESAPSWSRNEADAYAAEHFPRFRGYLETINTFGGGDPSLGGPFAVPESVKSVRQEAQLRNQLEGARRQLAAESRQVARAFGIEGPIHKVENGRVEMEPIDYLWEGKPLFKSLSDGTRLVYRENGTPMLNKAI